ncbi:chromatin assembly factor 1 subunit A-B isoform X1 [Euwallacea fornicatus]|uniref:chromatin assembly factor 1 subunit A-B isoform X1 n=2 Tax=Euwallacea fornicatus TaxID=995702 RepID=UPI00338FEEE4
MFGFSLSREFLRGSTHRTWNCVSNIATVIWGKFNHLSKNNMPRSRKRHYSRSRSRSESRSPSGDRGHDRIRKPGSHEKDGKRRRIDADSPPRSISSNSEMDEPIFVESNTKTSSLEQHSAATDDIEKHIDVDICRSGEVGTATESVYIPLNSESLESHTTDNTEPSTPKNTPKRLLKHVESEKKKQQKQKEKEEREKQRLEEKAKILAEKQKVKERKEVEKQKLLEEKQKLTEIKRKEKELKEEQKKKEREDKDQKRKEKEQEKLKKLQETEEKHKEKRKEEEMKQKSATLLKNFFKKTESVDVDQKISMNKPTSYFMPFELKCGMKLPPPRRPILTGIEAQHLDSAIESQDESASYLKDLKSGKIIPSHCTTTWALDDPDIVIIEEEDKQPLGESICEDTSVGRKMKAKYLSFGENRRPPFYGTWRKSSKFIKPRRPFGRDTERFNYEEDSDDDWEEEEQGESLEVYGEEDEKDATNEQDDYEVDNDFFVPHGHLSDDEIDDDVKARLSPESLKHKLKLLNDEFEKDIKSKTHKLKPRFIGCFWVTKTSDDTVDEVYRCLQPYAWLVAGPVEVKKRFESSVDTSKKTPVKGSMNVLLPSEYIPHFLKIIHGNVKNKIIIVEEFLTYMEKNGYNVDVSKNNLLKFLRTSSSYKKAEKGGPIKGMCWLVHDDVLEKYNIKQ